MSHPVLWPKKTFFYPIGNTPPVCLTQDLAPEDPAKILLLGCGDPRSILYTLYSSLKCPRKTRPLDFTCCDFEPAVLARNALLFTLILDGHSPDDIWPIFFHFKISPKSIVLLTSQCEKLLAADFEIASSPYSDWLRFCSRDTLSRIRRHWQLYAEAKNFTQEKTSQLQNAFTREFKLHYGDGESLNFSASRSAGPFWMRAMGVVGKHFHYYWEAGILSRNRSDVVSATEINPTFVYSLTGEGCAVHYGTYPLQCFHLAEAYATSNATSWEQVTEEVLVATSMSQFRCWCQSFKAGVSGGSVVIRLFAGDALAFCKTLQHVRETSSLSASLYTESWSGTELILGGDYTSRTTSPAPTIFDSVDTSNIIDHVGLLNLLIVTIPLLRHSPTATLYTEALLIEGKDKDNGLQKRLCMDIPTAVTLFGIAPVGCISNFSSISSVHEVVLHHMLKGKQYQERIGWKVPYLGDSSTFGVYLSAALQPSFEPGDLANILFNIYYKMFSNEDMSIFKKAMSAFGFYGSSDVIHYHRASFVALLGMVKSRIRTDWTMTMEALLDLLHSDRKLAGSNNYQEFCCLLYMTGIYCVDSLGPDAAEAAKEDHSKGIFKDWAHVPTIVCLVMAVPRSNVKVIEGMDPREIGSPMFECKIHGSTSHNIFSSIQVVFGRVTIQGCGEDAHMLIEEDTAGLHGSSPLIFSVWVPASGLAMDGSNVRISLGLHSTAATSQLVVRLGLGLELFSASLTDRNYVHVVSARPNRAAELCSFSASSPRSPLPHTTSQKVTIICENKKISGISARWDAASVALPTGEVKHNQVSPCTMTVCVGYTMEQHLIFPFPINGGRPKLRIARKSGWIEIIAPILWPYSPERFFMRQFSPLLLEDQAPQLWNIHRLNLDSLPVFGTSQSHKSEWVSMHVSAAFSDREAILRERADNKDILSLVKDTLHSLFVHAVEPNALQIYAFADPSNGGIYTIIFVNELRIDLAGYTLVADTCILPLTTPLLKKYGQQIASLTLDGKTMSIITNGVEVTAWKHLLPALAERCRTWSHKKTCEYVKTGKVPLSVDISANPLCSCGEGLNIGTLSKVRGWKQLAPFMTRVAFSPLFAMSYLESTEGLFNNIPSIGEATTRPDGAGGRTHEESHQQTCRVM